MRATIYTRISRDREGASLGVRAQEQDCKELAASLGFTIVSTHSDNDISAQGYPSEPTSFRQGVSRQGRLARGRSKLGG